MSAPKRDPQLEEMIDAAVMGDPTSPWDTDPKYPGGKDLESMFNGGDQQALLWAVTFSARERKPAPEWAAEALADIMYRMATGEFETWDEAFGRMFPRKKRITMLLKARDMINAYNRVIELSKDNPIGSILFQRIGDELHIGKNAVGDYYARVRDWVKARRK
jgi:hypothetical protein